MLEKGKNVDQRTKLTMLFLRLSRFCPQLKEIQLTVTEEEKKNLFEDTEIKETLPSFLKNYCLIGLPQ